MHRTPPCYLIEAETDSISSLEEKLRDDPRDLKVATKYARLLFDRGDTQHSVVVKLRDIGLTEEEIDVVLERLGRKRRRRLRRRGLGIPMMFGRRHHRRPPPPPGPGPGPMPPPPGPVPPPPGPPPPPPAP